MDIVKRSCIDSHPCLFSGCANPSDVCQVRMCICIPCECFHRFHYCMLLFFFFLYLTLSKELLSFFFIFFFIFFFK